MPRMFSHTPHALQIIHAPVNITLTNTFFRFSLGEVHADSAFPFKAPPHNWTVPLKVYVSQNLSINVLLRKHFYYMCGVAMYMNVKNLHYNHILLYCFKNGK